MRLVLRGSRTDDAANCRSLFFNCEEIEENVGLSWVSRPLTTLIIATPEVPKKPRARQGCIGVKFKHASRATIPY
jgi:hypothetical protein